MDHLGGANWSSRISFYNIERQTINGISHTYIEDFDNDGNIDILGGYQDTYSKNYAGSAYLFYGDGDWSSIGSSSQADFSVYGGDSDYLVVAGEHRLY